MMRFSTSKITFLGIMASIGIIIGYLESLIILPISVPGIKLGLSNIVTVLVLYLYGPIEAAVVLLVRVLLSGLMFGSLSGIIYSISGAVFSFLAMRLIYKSDKVSCIGVSALGGVIHNMAQLFIAALVLGSYYVFYYVPALMIAGVLAGVLVGLIGNILVTRLKTVFKE